MKSLKYFTFILIFFLSLFNFANITNNDYILIKDWTLINKQCNNCVSLWCTIYKSVNKDVNGYTTYIVYLRSASLYSNGAIARTEYTNLNFYYGSILIHNSKWGIIGFDENTQQHYTIKVLNGSDENKLTFNFEKLKIN